MKHEMVEISRERIEELMGICQEHLRAQDARDIKQVLGAYVHLGEVIGKRSMTIQRLRQLLFGSKSEKLRDLFGSDASEEKGGEAAAPGRDETSEPEGAATTEKGEEPAPELAAEAPAPSGAGEGAQKPKPKGHGRHGAEDYEGAERVRIEHETLRAGDPCPREGCEGKVYAWEPRTIVRVTGRAPLWARVVLVEQLRCNLCLEIFPGPIPEDVGEEKYDATATSMIALLRYGTGLPFNRLARLQANFKVPLPATTQWHVVHRAAKRLHALRERLIVEAAQGDVLHNDDTPMKILSLMKKKRKKGEADDG